MDAQVTVARQVVEHIVFDRIKPDDTAKLARVVWDTSTVTFVFRHAVMSGPQTVTVHAAGDGFSLEYRALPL